MLIEQKEVLKLLRKYNLVYPKTLIFSESKLESIKLKFPVALKVDSSQIIHKSDFGVVHIGIKDLFELNRHLKTLSTLMKMHNITKYSFIVQEMVKGQELIIGMNRDEVFDTVIVFGLGGVFTEIIKDVSMRVAPLTKKDCYDMIDEIKGKKIFEGYRNIKPIKKERLVEVLMNLSKLAMNEKHIKEIDFNPVMFNEKHITVVDARMIK
jgi:acyl-CoA synthetase (NDP forming)